jgi:hypothetical protein
MLVIKGDHITALGEGQHIREHIVAPQPHIPNDLCGALLHRGGEHSQSYAEGNSRLLHHPSQLAAADDPHGRKSRGNMGLITAGHDERLVAHNGWKVGDHSNGQGQSNLSWKIHLDLAALTCAQQQSDC